MANTMGRRVLLGMGLAALAGGIAVAQDASPPGGAAGPGPGHGMMGDGAGGGMMGGGPGGGMMGGGWTTASYLDSLKTRLGIAPQQEPAWNEYADIVRSVGEQMQALHRTMFEAMGTASWQERRDMMNTMFGARQQAFAAVQHAATALVPALTPAQRTLAERMLPGLAYRHGMGRGMGMGHGMGQGMMGTD